MPTLVKQRALILCVLLLAATGVIAGPGAAADTAPAATERLQALDHEILVRLNETRAAHGLRPLALSDDLQDAAVTHSRAMLEGGFFAHESKDGSSFVARVKRHYRASGYTAWSAGENLLYSTDAVDAAAAIEAWLASPAHRQNMLTPDRIIRAVELYLEPASPSEAGFAGREGGAPRHKVKPRKGHVGAERPVPVSSHGSPGLPAVSSKRCRTFRRNPSVGCSS